MNNISIPAQFHIAYRLKNTHDWKHVNRDFVSEITARAQCQRIHDRFIDFHGNSNTDVMLINLAANTSEIIEYDGGVSHEATA